MKVSLIINAHIYAVMSKIFSVLVTAEIEGITCAVLMSKELAELYRSPILWYENITIEV